MTAFGEIRPWRTQHYEGRDLSGRSLILSLWRTLGPFVTSAGQHERSDLAWKVGQEGAS
jgi:hypothetical protein